MKGKVKYLLLLIFFSTLLVSQNETKKWYFGNFAGLDFSTVNPTILNSGAMSTTEGCASIADVNGNLLFYTDAITVWNQTHAVMANGTGLLGNGPSFSTQGAIILPKPGSPNLYYIFTTDAGGGVNGLRYSIVDMSLALGNGSVTIKNTLLNTPCAEKLAATKHCNGIDYWVLSHDMGSNNFRAYLLTSAGVNTTAVISSVGATYTLGSATGCMKFSPNGKKIGMTVNIPLTGFYSEIYDFDSSTGIVSNQLVLTGNSPNPYGVEFSPDGSKFYSANGNLYIYQWNLCAGSNTAIISSQYTISANFPGLMGSMQLASNGKIYIARQNQQAIDVINNPNAVGAACNYVNAGQSIAPATSQYGLPNFSSSFFNFNWPIPSFTYSLNPLNCRAYSFSSPVFTVPVCSAVTYSLINVQWNFGDPASGINNTSVLSNPSHTFSGQGSYTTSLILFYSCGGKSDTLKQVININSPSVSIVTNSITCANLGSGTLTVSGGIGPFSYLWQPNSHSTSVVNSLIPGNYTITLFDSGLNCSIKDTVHFAPLVPLSGTLQASSALLCNSINNGSANIVGLSGGSGNQFYLWTNGINTFTNPIQTNLGAGNWSVTVTDALTACQINSVFTITQPPALSLNITAGSATACVNTNISLSANATGGTGPYTYTWQPGAVGASAVATQSNGGTYSYSVNALDANVCSISANTTLSFVNNPSLSVSNASICPLQTGTLTAFGANTYTWLPSNSSGNSFTQSPMATAQYTVLGTTNSCTAQATVSIVVKAPPVPTLSANSPLCNNQSLNLSATGGTAYVWSGPLGFNSSVQNPVMNPVAPNQSGLYSATLTGANSCTAAASVSVTVHPTPTLSVPGATLCSNQNMSLSAVSVAGASYYWQGPASFTSNAQFPVVATPPASLSGLYQVTVTSAQNCSNTASANVTITALPNVTITANSPLCFGSALFLSGSGALNYNWTGPNGFSSAAQNTSLAAVSFSQAGTYSLTATTGPCVVWLTKTITVNPLPNPTAGYNTPLCELKPLYLVAGPAQSYTWSGPQNFSSTLQSPSLAAVGFSNAGQYSLSVTDGNGCVGHTSLVVNVLSNPIPIASGATVCLGGNVSLSASGGIAYSWSGPNNFSANTQNLYLQNIVANQTGNYTVIVTGSNSCSSYTTANLQGFNYSLPNPTIVATSSVCVNSSITLQGSGGLTYSWSGPEGFVSTSNVISFVALNTNMSGTYTLSVSNASYCVGSNTVFIQVYPLPSATLISSQNNRCVPFCTEFSLLRDPASASLQSFQYFIEGQFYTEPVAKACITQSGAQKANVYYSDVHSCSNASTLLITAYPKPRAEFEYFPAKPIAGIDRVEFTNRTQGSKQNGWAWLFSSGDSLWGENVSFLFQEAGTYPVALLVSNEWNCLDTVIKAVPVLEDFALYVPNAFTPNGDGLNDVFRAAGTGIHSYRLEIYNRWGHNLFASEDFLQGWDGYYKGEPCQEDVYSYKIIYSIEGGKTFEKSGWVILER